MKIQLSPKLYAFLSDLESGPQPRPKGTIVGAVARRAGYTEDEVEYKGRRIGAAEAKALLRSRDWYLSTKSTGNERLTEAGRAVLDQHRSGR